MVMARLQAGNGDKIAFLWEGNDLESKAYTYKDMLDRVSQTANMLKSLGVKKGDMVCIPASVTMLYVDGCFTHACATRTCRWPSTCLW